MNKYLMEEIQHISLAMFNKNFFGAYHGSISARVTQSSFITNTKNSILNEVTEESLITLNSHKKDHRWKQANIDAPIHAYLYNAIPNAKYVSFSMPPYATAYSLKHSKVIPQDYHGYKILGEISIYDPKSFEDWRERSHFEIPQFFQKHETHILLIKGFGVISYDRDITEMAKKVSILENSCRLLALSATL